MLSRPLLFLLFALALAGPLYPLRAIEPVMSARLADGFDFPVGKPNGEGYYKARGFRSNGHLGEDWNGARGGDTDQGDPIFCIGHGVVILARDMQLGWGNVVIVRHAYYDGSQLGYVDSLYGHLERMTVTEGQTIIRGQQLGTMGSNRGMYDAHLHFEIRKNLAIGMNRASFARDSSNYHDPTAFIQARRSIAVKSDRTLVAMNTATTRYPGSRIAAVTLPIQDDHSQIEATAPRVQMNPVSDAAPFPAEGPSVTTNTSGKARGAFKIDRFGDIRGAL